MYDVVYKTLMSSSILVFLFMGIMLIVDSLKEDKHRVNLFLASLLCFLIVGIAITEIL